VGRLEALVPDGAEEGYGKFQPHKLAREAHDLGIDAVLQDQGLLHRSNSSRNRIAQMTQFAKVFLDGAHGLA
jgi:hypothetical protein